VRGASDDHGVADDAAGYPDGEVVLPEVQHVGVRGQRDVGPVVDGEQGAVPRAHLGEHLQSSQLVPCLQRPVGPLVAQLHDVDPTGEGGVDELGEIAAVAAGVGAEVEAGGGEALAAGGGVESGHDAGAYAQQ
jgi:hypothetical protein